MARDSAHGPDTGILGRLTVLAALAGDERERLAVVSRFGRRSRNAWIAWEVEGFGDTAIGVLSGAVRMSLQSGRRSVAVVTLGAGQVVEIDEGGWSDLAVTTAEVVSRAADFVLMPGETVHAVVARNETAQRLLRLEELRLRRELAVLSSNSLHPGASERVAHQTWWALHQAGSRGARLTEAYIAARAGTTQQRVSLEFRRYIVEGIMLRDPRTGRLVPLDLDRLLDGM